MKDFQEFTIGDKELDRQHKELFNQFNTILEKYNNKENIYNELKMFYRSFSSHISYEEKYMLDIGFPDIAFHTASHDIFLDNLEELIMIYLKEEKRFMDELLFILNWITQHILGQDMKITEWYAINRISKSNT